jgi:CHAT domain-containing protein
LCARPDSTLAAIRIPARQLYKALIEPVSSLARRNQTLLIQTDENFSPVPFQVLVDGSGRYLEDLHPVTYLPGLNPSSDPQPDHLINRDARVLVVAGGAGTKTGFRPLTDALAEAKMVAHYFPQGQLLVDAQASLPEVGRQLSQAEIFHFAGHALTGSDQRGLLLTAADRSDGMVRLDAGALRTISLPNLQMAVLSACSTENGDEGLFGDFDSMARAFVAKGAPHVIASRWNVDSSSTASLMDGFYNRLFAGDSVPQALATAEARLRQKSPHPYYWAAFDAFGQN